MARAFGRMFVALLAGAVGGAVVSALRSESGSARPMAKRAVRAGLQLYEQARRSAAEWGEQASDLVAEAQAEFDEERAKAAVAPREERREEREEQVVPFETRPLAEAERKLG